MLEERQAPNVGKLDRRLTGASNIDEQLQEILDLIFSDYVKTWYSMISDDTAFLIELRKVFSSTISSFATRAKEVDWTPFFTETLVDELASHVKLYRRADEKVGSQKSDHEESEKTSTADLEKEIESAFFEFEMGMEEQHVCREAVCTDEDMERRYLQEIVEALLYFLLPKEAFGNPMCRFLVREILVNGVIFPTVDKICEPDYFNQNIIWMCYDSTLTSESFLTALRMSSSIPEIESVLVKVRNEISRVRSKDTGGVDDTYIKQTLRSLSYLEKICLAQIARLSKSTDEVDFLDVPQPPSSLKNLPFEFAVSTEVCIQYFSDYLLNNGNEMYLKIYLDLENQELKEDTLQFAVDILEKYSSDVIHHDQEDMDLVAVFKSLQNALEKDTITAQMFERLQEVVYNKLQELFEEFKGHTLYLKMLRELDVESGSMSSFSDESSECMSASHTVSSSDEDKSLCIPTLTAKILQAGIVKESKPDRGELTFGRTYVIYSIKVTQHMKGDKIEWDIKRRYSDFDDLHTIVCEKFPELRDVTFPRKSAFNNTNKDFLEKRVTALSEYLEHLLTSPTYHSKSALYELMMTFLQTGEWEKPRDTSTNKVGSLMKKMSNTVIRAPDAILNDVIDGFGKGFGRIKTKLSLAPTLTKNQLDGHRVRASLDTEHDDNIPMRIMLLMMDEIFDLRKKNQWLRRRIVAILRQIIKAAYGDTINRKIVSHVENLTSADQVAEYIKLFKERFWPSGCTAEASSPRDMETLLRTCVVCRAKMIGSVPDELRHLIGSETTRYGILRVFKMFQHKRLNKRLFYAILEAVIKTLFSPNSFEKVFSQIHYNSRRGRADSSFSQSSV